MKINKMIKTRFPGLFLIALAVSVYNIPVNAGTNAGTAGAFLRMGLGARNLAMGDVGVANSGDAYGIFYNPASLPDLPKRTVVMTYNYLALDRNLNFVGFATPLHPPAAQTGKTLSAGIGVGWISAGTGDLIGRTNSGEVTGEFKYADNAFFFSFALRLADMIAVGFSPKILYSYFPDLTDSESLTTSRLGFDAGILANPIDRLYFGAQVRNVNAQNRWDTSTIYGEDGTTTTEKFPQIYRFGGRYDFNFGLSTAVEIETSDKEDNQLHAGFEYNYQAFEPYLFSLRAGYDDQDLAFGFGVGFDIWKVNGQLDYAYQIQDVPPFDSQVISFAVSF